MDLKKDLLNLIKGEVKDDSYTLDFYSVDASIFRIKPKIVVFPKNTADIKTLVNYVNKYKSDNKNLSITPRSAGTDMGGGTLNESIIMDLNHHLREIKDFGTDWVSCEPGLFYRNLEKETLKRNLIFPSYPASKSIASVGGIVANNAGGEMSLRYGKTEDYINSLKVILSDGQEYEFKKINETQMHEKLALKTFEGNIYRQMYELISQNYDIIQAAKPKVSKNSTGYLLWKVFDKKANTFDLSKIFVGSQGTLGIITEIKFHLVKTEKYSKMLVIYLNDTAQLANIVNLVLQYKPTDFESYDDKTLKLALKFAPQIAHLISKETNIFKFAFLLLPDFKIMLKMRSLPKLVLMAEFNSDNMIEIDKNINELNKALLKKFNLFTHIPKNSIEEQKYWIIRRQSFNLLRKKIKGKQTVPFIDDIIVQPKKMPEFLLELNAILAQYSQLTYTIAGHVGNGNFHIIPLMDMTDANQRAIIPKLAEKVYDLVFQYGGSMSGEHNDGLIRGPYLEKMYGKKIFDLFKEVKNIFDPKNIFNPHKKTDANLQYSSKFIKKDNKHNI